MNLSERLARVDWAIVEELEHIPKGEKGSLQETLRREYAAYRSIHRKTGSDLPARAALDQALINIWRTEPGFEPAYDAAFFEQHLRALSVAPAPVRVDRPRPPSIWPVV